MNFIANRLFNHSEIFMMGGKTTALLVLAVTFGCGREQKYNQYLEVGLHALKNKRYERAAQHLNKAVKINPTSSTAYYNLGVAYGKVKKMDRAILALTMASDLESSDPRPMLMLSIILREEVRWNDARNVLVKLNNKLPDNPEILTNFAALEYGIGEVDRAKSLLDSALKINFQYAPALFNMAILKRDHDKDQLASLRYFSKFITASENNIHIDKAKEEIQMLRSHLFDFDVLPLDTLQSSNVQTSKYLETERRVEGAFISKLRPLENKDTTSNMYTPAFSQKDYEKALLRLKKKVHYEPRNPDALWALATLYNIRLRQDDKAIASYQRFIEVFPLDPRAKKARVWLDINYTN